MAQNGTRVAGPRCIALVGPFQSGKTTLLEAILARTGAIGRQGTVDAGTTVGASVYRRWCFRYKEEAFNPSYKANPFHDRRVG
jgi:ATPase subunit of ABC transporter with duplicated ATPase domains